jgi:serralysin
MHGGFCRDGIDGSDGKDTLNGGNMGGSDSLWGGAGVDTATYTGADAAVVLSLGNGGAANTDVLFDIENLKGSAFDDLLSGDVAANRLDGGGGNDGIDGGDGNDTLVGGTGNDTLTGGDGADVFRFSSALNGSINVDRIGDFGASDALQLENSVFTALTSTGVLSAANFRASSSGTAADSNDFVLYETDTGKLFYDTDGSGADAAVLVATLTGAPVLGAADIFVT